jgi:hypothetical protein
MAIIQRRGLFVKLILPRIFTKEENSHRGHPDESGLRCAQLGHRDFLVFSREKAQKAQKIKPKQTVKTPNPPQAQKPTKARQPPRKTP